MHEKPLKTLKTRAFMIRYQSQKQLSLAEQAIRFPTDLSLLNEARELSEKIIDLLYPIRMRQRNLGPTDR